MTTPTAVPTGIVYPLFPEKDESLFGFAIFCIVLCTVFLIVRFWSRTTLPTRKFGIDDWLTLLAFPFVIAQIAITATLMRVGFGRHVQEVPPDNITLSLQLLFAGILVYVAGITALRCSVIMFYYRIFESLNRHFLWALWATLACNLLYVPAIGFLTIFQCAPVKAFWYPMTPGAQCQNLFHTQLGAGVSSILLDFMILVLPLPVVWKLQMKPVRKILVSGIFVIGYCIIGITIGRTVSVFAAGPIINTDLTYGFVTTVYWFCAEITTAFVSVSLPAFIHLFTRAYRHGPQALFNDREYTNTAYDRKYPSRKYKHESSNIPSRDEFAAGHQRSLNPGSLTQSSDTTAYGEPELPMSDLESGTIRKTWEVTVVNSPR